VWMGKVKKGNLKQALADAGGSGNRKAPAKKGRKAMQEAKREVQEQATTAGMNVMDGGGAAAGPSPAGGGGEVASPSRYPQLPEEVMQGRNVLDPVTRGAYYLPVEEEERQEACFRWRADEARDAKWRLAWAPALTPKEVLAGLSEAHAAGGDATLFEFVLANHDMLGTRAAMFLSAAKLSAQFRKDAEEALRLRELLKAFIFAELRVNVGWKQVVLDAEVRVSKIVGNLAALQKEAAKLGASDVAGTWVLLKAAVCTWEDKYVAEEEAIAALQEKQMGRSDPSMRFDVGKKEKQLANTRNNMALWQQMAKTYGEVEPAMDKLLPELKFLDRAFYLPSSTEVRRYAATEFCPEHGMTEAELRRRLRHVLCAIQRLTPTNYLSLYYKVLDIVTSVSRGTEDDVEEMDYYARGQEDGTLYFETYDLPRTEASVFRDFTKKITDDDRSAVFNIGGKRSAPSDAPVLDWFHGTDDFEKEDGATPIRIDPDTVGGGFESFEVRQLRKKLERLEAEFDEKEGSGTLPSDLGKFVDELKETEG